jgi:hypothetical protein
MTGVVDKNVLTVAKVVKRLKGWWGHDLSVVVMDVKSGSPV